MNSINSIGGMQGLENLRQAQRPESGRMGPPPGGMQGVGAGQQRPDPAQSAQKAGDLFLGLDTSQRGYITKDDLQAAFDGSSSTEGASSDFDALFSVLDTDNDGAVTKQEFVDTLVALRDAGRPGGGGGSRGMDLTDDGSSAGFSMDQITQQIMTLMQNVLGEDSSPGSWVSDKA